MSSNNQNQSQEKTMNVRFEAMQGKCRCGQIQFEITVPPILTMACHCKGCQRMSASAFSLSATIPSEAFSILQGEPVIGGLHGDNPHYFCSYCMSWLFTRVKSVSSFVNLRIAMLEDPKPFPPYIETCTNEKLSWASTPAAHSFEHFPPPEGYEELVEQYMSREVIN